ncbi:tRNA-splicing endonuclease subunit Sen2 [Chlorella sorokiniana]|uniref:tRNA-intron lyase n=1 Tax=Chlorella sorokiniana TaxID=3076 RepID=A0A2P6TSS5_CHLSO|nr:tRNA-splicing endonuclease subunit Sen2 [Chlorella sorokiniana]|eukprot:PRW57103.1 tRNA-splicing endonuclease subunit Sen2 [Chlorella sorokiniana]
MAGMGPERPREQRKMKKWRRRDLNTNLLEVCRELRPRDLQALLLDAAVWLCCDDDTVYKLDTLCFGNLDGGAGTAAYVRQHLEAAGWPVQGDKAVRLSLDEAFFMAYALGILTVHELAEAGSTAAGSGGVDSGSAGAAGEAAGAAAPGAAAAAAEQQGAAMPAAAAESGGAAAAAAAPSAAAGQAAEPAGAAAAAVAPAAPAEPGLVAVPLDHVALWRRLQQSRPDFFLLYLAYHHFRSKGWIPRTGLQYGADFVLYQRHPALAHSDYAVSIVPLRPGQRAPMGWHDLQISNRLSTQVSKRLLLLYVQEPEGGADRSSPNALAQVAVHERLVRRWVPESHRLPPPGSK